MKRLFSRSRRAESLCYSIIRWRRRGFIGRIFSKVVQNHLASRFGIYLAPTCSIGGKLKLPHPVGIVIGEGVVIGNNVTIYQHVTIGRRYSEESSYPRIGDNTVLYAGCVVSGGIVVGSNVSVGANSVVLTNIPDGTTAVGVPARLISRPY